MILSQSALSRNGSSHRRGRTWAERQETHGRSVNLYQKKRWAPPCAWAIELHALSARSRGLVVALPRRPIHRRGPDQGGPSCHVNQTGPSEEVHHARTAGLELGRAAGSALRGIVAT